VPAGRRIEEPVSLRRLPATIVDLIGTGEKPFPGQSLRETWSAGRTEPGLPIGLWLEQHPWTDEGKPAFHGPVTSVLDARWQWISDGRGQETLFQYRDDLNEERNLADQPEGQETRRTLGALLKEKSRLQ
jgi:hypothetical protein